MDGPGADQQRTKWNVYLKSIRNIEKAVGPFPVYDLERHHALSFRAWWLERIKAEGLKPYTANREINSLRRMINMNFNIDSITKPNPFARVRLKEGVEVTHIPLETEQIRKLLNPSALPNLHDDFRLLIRLLVNTGMRPVEAIGLCPEDILIDEDVPHVHIRKNAIRGLKTDHSKLLLPLVGVSLQAGRQLASRSGWVKRAGKNM